MLENLQHEFEKEKKPYQLVKGNILIQCTYSFNELTSKKNRQSTLFHVKSVLHYKYHSVDVKYASL